MTELEARRILAEAAAENPRKVAGGRMYELRTTGRHAGAVFVHRAVGKSGKRWELGLDPVSPAAWWFPLEVREWLAGRLGVALEALEARGLEERDREVRATAAFWAELRVELGLEERGI